MRQNFYFLMKKKKKKVRLRINLVRVKVTFAPLNYVVNVTLGPNYKICHIELSNYQNLLLYTLKKTR